jgi:hypothetical protein
MSLKKKGKKSINPQILKELNFKSNQIRPKSKVKTKTLGLFDSRELDLEKIKWLDRLKVSNVISDKFEA